MAPWLFKFRKLLRILGTPLWRSALWRCRVAAGVEHTLVLRSIAEIHTLVDIGANRGQFALAVRNSFPNVRIVSFEPLAAPASVYKLIFKDDQNVQLIEAAVGPIAGEAEIHISARDDSSSLLPITARQNSLFPGTAEAAVTNIQVFRLTDVMTEREVVTPALLKLDVQGYELEALNGCVDLLDKFSWVYVECSFMELYAGQALAGSVIEWLGSRGFNLCGVYNVTYDRNGCAIQADFLFSRDDIIDRDQTG